MKISRPMQYRRPAALAWTGARSLGQGPEPAMCLAVLLLCPWGWGAEAALPGPFP